MSIKIAFVSLGCDKNRVDSEVMLGLCKKNEETEVISNEAEADVIVVNTCCFIQDALSQHLS